MFAKLSSYGFPAHKRPIVIAGPCGAESEEQVLETALLLKQQGVDAIRAGIWKPRTRPGSFEGMGADALKWVKNAGIATDLPVMVEVASPKHIEQALKAKIDILWLGARTTVNPFLMQELADVLQGVDIPVFVKNPVNPDLSLWIGAIERIHRAGINKIAAIHRGFSSYENHTYRNKPNWEIPIELRRRFPDLPLFCDPSHICGNTFMLEYVSQFALDLQYDGLMIESHREPQVALSDANQQLTPAELGEMLSRLLVRKPMADDPVELSRLEDLRDQIDEADHELLSILAKRMEVARNIGKHKYYNNIAILQPKRWQEIINSRTKMGESKRLTNEFILKLYNLIHQESIFQQTDQMIEEKKSDSAHDESVKK